MASNLPTLQTISRLNQPNSFDVAAAVNRGELVLSLSTMLGCDYIFISHKGPHALLESKRLEITVRELLDMMESSPQQSMLVSADEKGNGELVFTRYDYKWESRQVSDVITTRVTHPEQADFMRMMLNCSTIC